MAELAVKPLEWRWSHKLSDEWYAEPYKIRRVAGDPDLYILSGWRGGTNPYGTLDEAKAAAQADYEQRIRSALGATPPSPVAPEIEALVERLKQVGESDHIRGCQGREYNCTCGYDDLVLDAALDAKRELTRMAGDIERLKGALLAIAVGCHRAKWSYENLPVPAGTPSVFDFLHRLGDQANEAARAALAEEG